MRSFRLALALVCLGATSSTWCAAANSALDKPTLEAYMRRLFGWPADQVTVTLSEARPSPLAGYVEVELLATAGQASQQETLYVSKDGRKILRGSVYDINESPFQADLVKLRTEQAPRLGEATAPVSIVLFSDFQCSFCREEAKVLRENLLKTYAKEVKLFFKDYPLEQIHPWARAAAIAGRCIYGQNPSAFWTYHDWVFAKQEEIAPDNLRAKIEEFAKSNFMNVAALAACIDSKTTEPDVNRSITEARGLRINSTPTMFVNGRRLVGKLEWPQLKAIIDEELQHARKLGDKCCEVTLPGPSAAGAGKR